VRSPWTQLCDRRLSGNGSGERDGERGSKIEDVSGKAVEELLASSLEDKLCFVFRAKHSFLKDRHSA
jgi:hypothetical protein